MRKFINDYGLTEVDFEISDIVFELEFIDFEMNRMYPPNYRKVLTMKRPTIKHADCVRNCLLLLETGMSTTYDPKVRKRIQKDIDTMSELHKILIYIMDNPTLPFVGFPVELESANSFQQANANEECNGI